MTIVVLEHGETASRGNSEDMVKRNMQNDQQRTLFEKVIGRVIQLEIGGKKTSQKRAKINYLGSKPLHNQEL